MLGIGRPDRHALPRITSSKNAPTTTRALLPRERVRCVPGMLNKLGGESPLPNLMEVKG